MRIAGKLRAALLALGLAGAMAASYWVDRQTEQANASAGAVVDAAPRRVPRAPEPTPVADGAPTLRNAAGLDLSRLQRSRNEDPTNDPFARQSFKPAPPQRTERPPSAPVQMAEPPPPPPSAPPVPFTYIGRLSEDSRTTVFLASGERNLVVKPGDVIDNNYRVDEVTDKTVQLTYLPLNVKQTVPTGAQ